MSADEISALTKVHEALEPLDIESRKRVIDWAVSKYQAGSRTAMNGSATPSGGTAGAATGSRVARWMASNNITQDHLDRAFHVEDGRVEVIVASLPAATRKEQVVQAYLVCGVAAMLSTEQPQFEDQRGRDLCQRLGCYDKDSHAKAFAEFGNKITGSKSSGWTLTAPGLSAAADVIRQAGNGG